MDRRMVGLAVFLALASSVISQGTPQYGCSNIQSACLSINDSIFICPEGMACLSNATCCKFADIIDNGATTVGPTTAGPVTNCVDKVNPNTGVSDCPKMTSYCNDPTYYQVMTDQCPKTCNRCGGGGGNPTAAPTAAPGSSCVDKINPQTGVSDCPGVSGTISSVKDTIFHGKYIILVVTDAKN
ncbi:hypothetical protein WR25_10386 isoform A [Diploscapter pachys]|uniref:ShKT domain-containing protein n=1 Tax=Diploscapter pachys TaxID=2018661 RepID=A0A2A2KZ11_9BILA|nr:hypothetical protein WR25_10386 isoform A [Diploscapter pachys]